MGRLSGAQLVWKPRACGWHEKCPLCPLSHRPGGLQEAPEVEAVADMVDEPVF